MDSQAVETRLGLDAGSWKQWPSINWAMVPKSYGVYFFRTAKGLRIPRVKGASDIVYVGSGIIRDRLKAHSRQDWKKWTGTGWVICLIMRAKGVDVAWQQMPQEKARHEESNLLQDFLVDHFELPAANRRNPLFSTLTEAMLALLSLDEKERAQVTQNLRTRVEKNATNH